MGLIQFLFHKEKKMYILKATLKLINLMLHNVQSLNLYHTLNQQHLI